MEQQASQQPQQPTKSGENGNRLRLLFASIKKQRWLYTACVALLFFLFVRKFLLDIVRVNNHDMENTFYYSDALLVKKRFNSYKRGDVIYLEYPLPGEDQSTPFFQRIVGLPGDCVLVYEKKTVVNGRNAIEPADIKHNYIVTSKTPRLDSLFLLSYGLTEGGPVAQHYDYGFSLTRKQSELLINNEHIKSIRLKMEKEDSFDENCFPWFGASYNWNRDFYGELYIPKKNDTLALDTINITLYTNIITVFENNTLEVRHDSIFVNAIATNNYVVKQNYYFVMGDNRDNANDSRVWGFLPQSCINGKVVSRIKQCNK